MWTGERRYDSGEGGKRTARLWASSLVDKESGGLRVRSNGTRLRIELGDPKRKCGPLIGVTLAGRGLLTIGLQKRDRPDALAADSRFS